MIKKFFLNTLDLNRRPWDYESHSIFLNKILSTTSALVILLRRNLDKSVQEEERDI